MTGLGQPTQLLVVTSGPEVDNGIAVIINARRGKTGGQQQLLVAEYLAGRSQNGLGVAVDAKHLRAESQFRASISDGSEIGLVPGELGIGPQLLTQSWPRIWSVDVGADNGDRPFLVDVTNTAGGRISRHPATDDEVLVRRHMCSQDGVHRRNDAYISHGSQSPLTLRGFQRAFALGQASYGISACNGMACHVEWQPSPSETRLPHDAKPSDKARGPPRTGRASQWVGN